MLLANEFTSLSQVRLCLQRHPVVTEWQRLFGSASYPSSSPACKREYSLLHEDRFDLVTKSTLRYHGQLNITARVDGAIPMVSSRVVISLRPHAADAAYHGAPVCTNDLRTNVARWVKQTCRSDEVLEGVAIPAWYERPWSTRRRIFASYRSAGSFKR